MVRKARAADLPCALAPGEKPEGPMSPIETSPEQKLSTRPRCAAARTDLLLGAKDPPENRPQTHRKRLDVDPGIFETESNGMRERTWPSPLKLLASLDGREYRQKHYYK